MRLKLTLVILLILLLGVQTGSAWSDHFTTDSSAHYTPTANWKWDSAAGNLSSVTDTAHTFYKDETFTKATITTRFANNHTIGAGRRDYVEWAASSTSGTVEWQDSTCQAGKTGYFLRMTDDGASTINLYKCVAGVYTSLDTATPGSGWYSDREVWYEVSITWDPTAVGNTIEAVVKKAGGTEYTLTSTDNTLNSGYVGLGNGYWTWFDDFDYLNIEEPATPTPTPTPTAAPTTTPIPAPIIIAENVTCKIGETWLRCNWTFNDNLTKFVVDDQTIYRNGTLYKQNYSQHYISFTDLNPNSLQIIEIWYKNFTYNNYTMKQYVQLRTHPGSTWWYFALGLLMSGVGYFVPVFGFLSIFLMATGMYMAYDLSSQGYTLLIYSLGFVLSIFITGWRLTR